MTISNSGLVFWATLYILFYATIFAGEIVHSKWISTFRPLYRLSPNKLNCLQISTEMQPKKCRDANPYVTYFSCIVVVNTVVNIIGFCHTV